MKKTILMTLIAITSLVLVLTFLNGGKTTASLLEKEEVINWASSKCTEGYNQERKFELEEIKDVGFAVKCEIEMQGLPGTYSNEFVLGGSPVKPFTINVPESSHFE